MTPFDFDAFGNPLPARSKTNGKRRPFVLYSDGVYNPALAGCYSLIPINRRRPATSSFGFTVPDNHAGETAIPANLQ